MKNHIEITLNHFLITKLSFNCRALHINYFAGEYAKGNNRSRNLRKYIKDY